MVEIIDKKIFTFFVKKKMVCQSKEKIHKQCLSAAGSECA